MSSEVRGRVLPLALGWSVVPSLAGWLALLTAIGALSLLATHLALPA